MRRKGKTQMRSPFILIAIPLIQSLFLSFPPGAAAEPAEGQYHLVGTHAEIFRWYDSLVAITNPAAAVWAILELKSFALGKDGAQLCVDGRHQFSDYGGEDFSLCESAGEAAGVSIHKIRGIQAFEFMPKLDSRVLKMEGSANDSLLFTYLPGTDTITLSMYWIRSSVDGSFFVPGNWAPASVEGLIRMFISQTDFIRDWTPDTWRMSPEYLTITRYTFKLASGASTGLVGASAFHRRPAPNPASRISGPDALGRDFKIDQHRSRTGFRLVPR
jgi:hypothetical protein